METGPSTKKLENYDNGFMRYLSLFPNLDFVVKTVYLDISKLADFQSLQTEHIQKGSSFGRIKRTKVSVILKLQATSLNKWHQLVHCVCKNTLKATYRVYRQVNQLTLKTIQKTS